jgi:hypothetical protein
MVVGGGVIWKGFQEVGECGKEVESDRLFERDIIIKGRSLGVVEDGDKNGSYRIVRYLD